MKNYMTTFKERLSYWTYFVGQNVYYNITFIYLSAYLAMQGIELWKVSLVLLIVKVDLPDNRQLSQATPARSSA